VKRLLFIALVLVVVAAAAFAQAKKGQFGTQVAGTITSTGASPAGALGARYMITDNIAVRAMLGFLNNSSTTTTGYDLLGAFEYHFAGKGGVSPYVGAEIGYSGQAASGGGPTPSDFGVQAVFGAEYFLSSNFSWGGEASLGFDSATSAVPATTTKLSTSVSTLLTWYLN